MSRVGYYMSVGKRLRYVIVLVMVLLAGCATTGTPTLPSMPTPDLSAELNLVIQQDPQLIAMLSAMLKAVPGGDQVKFNYQYTNYLPTQQIERLVDQGNPPDLIFNSVPYMAQLADKGLLLDMKEMVTADTQFKLNDLQEQTLATNYFKGRSGLYVLPIVADNIQLYYNKALLQKAGIAMPAAEWSWSDLIDTCKQLQTSLPGVTCLTLWGANESDYWYSWVRGYGGDVLSADGQTSTLGSDESLEGLQRYAELWSKHKVVTPLQFPSYLDCFISQHCAMMLNSADAIPKLNAKVGDTFAWATQLIPKHPKGRFSSGWSLGFAIGKTAKHPAAAWSVIRMLLSQSAQGVLLSSGYGLPVLTQTPLTSGQTVPDALRPFMEGRTFSVLMPAYPTVQSCGTTTSGGINRLVYSAFSDMFYKQSDFAKTLTQADQVINACIAKAREGGK
jgi:ABC-type glycerol-3-phosphate transport system substrate-binding protein